MRAVTDADDDADDDDNAGRHSTTTRATYRQNYVTVPHVYAHVARMAVV